MTEFEQNEQIANHICEQQQWQGRPFTLGEHVGLLDGEIVAVDADPLPVIQKVRSLDPDPKRGMVFVVGPAVVDVIRRA